MSEADFEKCLSDKEKLKTLEEITQYGSDPVSYTHLLHH